MPVAQNWSIMGIMATSLGVLVAVIFRTMGVHGTSMTTMVDGLRHEFTNALTDLRNELQVSLVSLGGLRNEVIVRLDHLDARLSKVETIDREVHALSVKVFGDDPPGSA